MHVRHRLLVGWPLCEMVHIKPAHSMCLCKKVPLAIFFKYTNRLPLRISVILWIKGLWVSHIQYLMWVRPLAFLAVLVLNGERNPSNADGDSYNLFVGFLCPCREGICIKDNNTYVEWTRLKKVDSDSFWVRQRSRSLWRRRQTTSNMTSPTGA